MLVESITLPPSPSLNSLQHSKIDTSDKMAILFTWRCIMPTNPSERLWRSPMYSIYCYEANDTVRTYSVMHHARNVSCFPRSLRSLMEHVPRPVWNFTSCSARTGTLCPPKNLIVQASVYIITRCPSLSREKQIHIVVCLFVVSAKRNQHNWAWIEEIRSLSFVRLRRGRAHVWYVDTAKLLPVHICEKQCRRKLEAAKY